MVNASPILALPQTNTNTMETIENNKLIAEFMGYKQSENGYYNIESNLPQFNGCDNAEWCCTEDIHLDWSKPESKQIYVNTGGFYWVIGAENLRYHSSWDWLMLVVEKIESKGYEVLIGRISCKVNKILYRDNPISSMVCGDISKKIQITYLAIVEFIKWYNKQ